VFYIIEKETGKKWRAFTFSGARRVAHRICNRRHFPRIYVSHKNREKGKIQIQQTEYLLEALIKQYDHLKDCKIQTNKGDRLINVFNN
jgi:hypothetical protein